MDEAEKIHHNVTQSVEKMRRKRSIRFAEGLVSIFLATVEILAVTIVAICEYHQEVEDEYERRADSE